MSDFFEYALYQPWDITQPFPRATTHVILPSASYDELCALSDNIIEDSGIFRVSNAGSSLSSLSLSTVRLLCYLEVSTQGNVLFAFEISCPPLLVRF